MYERSITRHTIQTSDFMATMAVFDSLKKTKPLAVVFVVLLLAVFSVVLILERQEAAAVEGSKEAELRTRRAVVGGREEAELKAAIAGEKILEDTQQLSELAYVAVGVSSGEGKLSIIDTATNRRVTTVGLSSPYGYALTPQGVGITPSGSKVYVAGGPPPQGSPSYIFVVDTARGMIVTPVQVREFPVSVSTTPDETKVYVANYGSNNISVIDATTNQVKATVSTGNRPNGIAVTPDGKQAYVTNWASSSVSVIDTATNQVTDVIPVAQFPGGISITPDGTRAYITNFLSNMISVIDTATNQVVLTFPVPVPAGGYPEKISITPNGNWIYITIWSNNSVMAIDTKTHQAVNTVSVGLDPQCIAFTHDSRRAYVTNRGNSTIPSSISVIDTTTYEVKATIDAGGGTYGLFGIAIGFTL
jgi:YVTN family beta-propeller protein